MNRYLTDIEIAKTFGSANEHGSPYLTFLELPFPMYFGITEVKRLRCHKLILPALKAVLDEILAFYGLDEIKRLRIDRFGGVFSYRMMRGANRRSRHSWGVAIDLDPTRNTLKMDSKKASFARPVYAPMITIFEKHGFISKGKTDGFDWMHFEVGSKWLELYYDNQGKVPE